jgi:biopolymer transport protein ExbD
VRFPRNAKIFRGQLDAAPFAGVLFTIVIMLLLTWRLAFTAGVRIDLPSVSRDLPGVANPVVVVVVDEDGQLHYQNQIVHDEAKLVTDLRTAAQESREPLTLAIYADRNVKLDSFMRIAAAARELGYKDVLLPTRHAGLSSKAPLPELGRPK